MRTEYDVGLRGGILEQKRDVRKYELKNKEAGIKDVFELIL